MNRLVLVQIEEQASILVLTLNRPDRHNSLIPALLEELLAAFQEHSGNPALRAVFLQANGRSFSTGGDAQGFIDHAADIRHYAQSIVGLLNEVILAMWDCPVPIVTAVHGILTGGSLGLVLASDVVLVSPETRFAPYYSAIGPSPDGGWAVLLPRVIGRQRAAQVLFTNHHITATEAVAWGLATSIVPGEEIHHAGRRIAHEIAAKKPGSIRHTRQLLNADRPEIARLLEMERDHFVQHIETPEAMDGFRHFLADLQSRKEQRV